MDLPPYGQEVLATLADGTVIVAYCKDGSWWQGVADDPNDWLVKAQVIVWELRTD